MFFSGPFFLAKFECLRGAVCKTDPMVVDFEAAWSELSAAGVQELTQEGGKMSFNESTDYAPLHQASFSGNLTAIEFLLVSK